MIADDEEVQEALGVHEGLDHGDQILRQQPHEQQRAGTKVHRTVGSPKSRTTGNRLPIQISSPPNRMVTAKPETMDSGSVPVSAAMRTTAAIAR